MVNSLSIAEIKASTVFFHREERVDNALTRDLNDLPLLSSAMLRYRTVLIQFNNADVFSHYNALRLRELIDFFAHNSSKLLFVIGCPRNLTRESPLVSFSFPSIVSLSDNFESNSVTLRAEVGNAHPLLQGMTLITTPIIDCRCYDFRPTPLNNTDNDGQTILRKVYSDGSTTVALQAFEKRRPDNSIVRMVWWSHYTPENIFANPLLAATAMKLIGNGK
jgi:hypothetical protein